MKRNNFAKGEIRKRQAHAPENIKFIPVDDEALRNMKTSDAGEYILSRATALQDGLDSGLKYFNDLMDVDPETVDEDIPDEDRVDILDREWAGSQIKSDISWIRSNIKELPNLKFGLLIRFFVIEAILPTN